jgi:DNA transposition AAA+ family ATPase
LSQSAAAKQIGVSAATLSQWLGAKYGGDNDAVEASVARWLDARGVAASAPRPIKIDFQRTETAERLWAMFTQAQHVPSIVVCAGVPGIGKTSTAKAYRDANPSVWLVTLDPLTVSPAQVLAEIAEAVGVQLGSHTTLRNRIGQRLEGSGGLLIIDEAQHMNAKALDMVRSLYDRYGVGIALAGNFGLFGGTAIPNKTHGLAQFFRRVTKRAKFERVSDRDVQVILDAWQVRDPDQRKFLALVAAKPWGLGGVQNVLFEAATLAAGEGQPMGVRHLRLAWAGLNHFDGGA